MHSVVLYTSCTKLGTSFPLSVLHVSINDQLLNKYIQYEIRTHKLSRMRLIQLMEICKCYLLRHDCVSGASKLCHELWQL